MCVVGIVLERAAPVYDREYDYLLPEGMVATAGCRVLVPFGSGNSTRLGWIVSLRKGDAPAHCKQVLRLLDECPLLGKEGLWLLRLLRETTFCTWSDALRVLIPPGAGMRLSMGILAQKGQDDTALSPEAKRLYTYLLTRHRMVDESKALAQCGLAPTHAALLELVEKGFVTRGQMVKKRIVDERAVMARLTGDCVPARPTPKQRAVLDLLTSVGCASVREICYFSGATRTVLDRLRTGGSVELFEEVIPRKTPDKTIVIDHPSPIVLSTAQQRVFDMLLLAGKTPGTVSLLHGVTGSGKTQVFLKLVEQTLAEGRRAIVLIPEIALTPQTMGLFESRFGSAVAVLHSSLSMTERLDEWNRIRTGKADIVVGTRSAIFAPLENLGLIVIDEEQEHTYHSESAPRYHARDIARARAKYHGAHLLLCSATPSVESFHLAQTGRCHFVTLSERYADAALPEVVVVDLREAPLAAGSTCVSEALSEELLHNLSCGEQSILLLNRRGYNTMIKCSSCGEPVRCPSCSVPMTFHAANGRMQCHYCGRSLPSLASCPSCKSALLRYVGAGTQRAEEELATLFPEARILRMDADTTMARFSHQHAFSAFSRGEYDIMVGTQMVAKGLDFPNVTLVGVLCADQSLYAEDFRGFEHTFSLLTQVVGRAGRASLPGRAIIQTFSPENRVLAFAAAQDYEGFFAEEISFRRVGLYPPFCSITCAVFSSLDEEASHAAADAFCAALIERLRADQCGLPARVLGPAECSPYRAAGKYRMRLLIKCRNDASMRSLLRRLAQDHCVRCSNVTLSLDMYYDSNI